MQFSKRQWALGLDGDGGEKEREGCVGCETGGVEGAYKFQEQ